MPGPSVLLSCPSHLMPGESPSPGLSLGQQRQRKCCLLLSACPWSLFLSNLKSASLPLSVSLTQHTHTRTHTHIHTCACMGSNIKENPPGLEEEGKALPLVLLWSTTEHSANGQGLRVKGGSQRGTIGHTGAELVGIMYHFNAAALETGLGSTRSLCP